MYFIIFYSDGMVWPWEDADMEIDFIFLKKEKAKSDSSLKELVWQLLGDIFI